MARAAYRDMRYDCRCGSNGPQQGMRDWCTASCGANLGERGPDPVALGLSSADITRVPGRASSQDRRLQITDAF